MQPAKIVPDRFLQFEDLGRPSPCTAPAGAERPELAGNEDGKAARRPDKPAKHRPHGFARPARLRTLGADVGKLPTDCLQMTQKQQSPTLWAGLSR